MRRRMKWAGVLFLALALAWPLGLSQLVAGRLGLVIARQAGSLGVGLVWRSATLDVWNAALEFSDVKVLGLEGFDFQVGRMALRRGGVVSLSTCIGHQRAGTLAGTRTKTASARGGTLSGPLSVQVDHLAMHTTSGQTVIVDNLDVAITGSSQHLAVACGRFEVVARGERLLSLSELSAGGDRRVDGFHLWSEIGSLDLVVSLEQEGRVRIGGERIRSLMLPQLSLDDFVVRRLSVRCQSASQEVYWRDGSLLVHGLQVGGTTARAHTVDFWALAAHAPPVIGSLHGSGFSDDEGSGIAGVEFERVDFSRLPLPLSGEQGPVVREGMGWCRVDVTTSGQEGRGTMRARGLGLRISDAEAAQNTLARQVLDAITVTDALDLSLPFQFDARAASIDTLGVASQVADSIVAPLTGWFQGGTSWPFPAYTVPTSYGSSAAADHSLDASLRMTVQALLADPSRQVQVTLAGTRLVGSGATEGGWGPTGALAAVWKLLVRGGVSPNQLRVHVAPHVDPSLPQAASIHVRPLDVDPAR